MKHTHYDADMSAKSAQELLTRLTCGYGNDEYEAIANALRMAEWAREHDTIKRPRGVNVAQTVHALRVDPPTVKAALLSDPYIRENLTDSEIERDFGPTVAELVNKVNWLNTFDEYRVGEPREPNQVELLRSMLLAVVNDVRAVLVKLAYRLERLRILKDQDEAIRRQIALETLDIFSPLANRLGVGQLKWELEDLSFRYLEPETYKHLAKSLATNRAERESFVQRVIGDLREALQSAEVKARVFGRPKHIYSIHRKMENKDLHLEELYDLHAVRVIVADVQSCYTVLGLVHSLWMHIPKEFDDYIANPKANGYQSLHTVVIGPEGRPVEIQIRTEDMHNFAEYGVAAHWRYKEGGKHNAAMDRNIAALRRLLESKEDDDPAILDSFRSELFEDQIFVLTPKGLVIRLKKGATPVDFAYAIHTEVGHRCRGCKVSGRIVPLTHTLKSGDKVEILVTKQGGPSRGWLDQRMGYVRTGHARNKIRAWFRQQDHEKHQRSGKAILDRERQKLGIKDINLDELAQTFHLPRGDDLLLAIGRTDISPGQLANVLKLPDWNTRPRQPVMRKLQGPAKSLSGFNIQGVSNLMVHRSRCCQPDPGDPIIGYVTVGRGIAIHRQDCVNILRLSPEKHGRLLDVSWGAEAEAFPVELEVRALDRKGLLKDIANIFSSEHINIIRTNTLTEPKDHSVIMHITAEVSDLGQLSHALDKIGEVHNVLEARRVE